MNTPKTTSIDWLQEQVQSNLSEPMSPKFAELFEQARDMEREQIIESYYAGTAQFANEACIISPKTPQNYYNETYGKSE
jgi:hypothetical protein